MNYTSLKKIHLWLFCSFSVMQVGSIEAQNKLSILLTEESASILEGADTVLCYQIRPKIRNGNYPRPNYIHPLYLLDGTVLTEDFPEDHPHHHGIFWAGHQLYVGEKALGDAWDVCDFDWDVVLVEPDSSQRASVALNTEVLWSSPLLLNNDGYAVPVVREQTSIRVYPIVDGMRMIDIRINLVALVAGVRIGGSANEKGYGGFSARIRLANKMQFTGIAGNVVPSKLPIEAGPWLDISGPIGRGGTNAGLCILAHPDNPNAPNPWILRKERSMQNAVYPSPGATPVPLSESDATVLRYRLVVHKGMASPQKIQRIYGEYCQCSLLE